MITKEQLEISEIAIEGLTGTYKDVVQKLKNKGLMASELCFIALLILENYSDMATSQKKMFKDLVNTNREAEEFLKSLQNKI